jgi:2'-5' RNA ligase
MIDPHSDTTRGYHLFLEPSTGELQTVIETIGDVSGGPRFVPHVTLLANIPEAPEAELIQKLHILVGDMKAFDVSLGDLEMQDAYYRALYYRIVPESAIIESHKAANQLFTVIDEQDYLPHLSVVYGNYTQEQKKGFKEHATVTPGTPLLLDRVSLWKTDGGVTSWKRIETAPLQKAT